MRRDPGERSPFRQIIDPLQEGIASFQVINHFMHLAYFLYKIDHKCSQTLRFQAMRVTIKSLPTLSVPTLVMDLFSSPHLTTSYHNHPTQATL